MIYNSCGSVTMGMPDGWRTNFNLTVTPVTSTQLKENGYYYYLTDSDGTEHYFKGNATSGKDEDGLGYTLNSGNYRRD